MFVLALVAGSGNLGTFAIVVGFGFLLGTIGHILRSRTMIVTGILVILMGIAGVFIANPPG
jgi:uncharacterized membrane protein